MGLDTPPFGGLALAKYARFALLTTYVNPHSPLGTSRCLTPPSAQSPQLPPLVRLSYTEFLREDQGHVLELGNEVRFFFPPVLSDGTLDLLFDQLTLTLETVIIKEDIVADRKQQIYTLCHEAEKLLITICVVAEFLSNIAGQDDALETSRIFILDSILLFLQRFDLASRMLLRLPSAMNLALVCRTYFCVALSYLRRSREYVVFDTSRQDGIALQILRDCYSLAALRPSSARYDWTVAYPGPLCSFRSFSFLLRHLSSYYSSNLLDIFAQIRFAFMSDSATTPPSGDALWLLIFNCIEHFQFSPDGLVAPVPDTATSAWPTITKLVQNNSSKRIPLSLAQLSRGKLETVSFDSLIALRCLSCSAILPKVEPSSLKDVWEALFRPSTSNNGFFKYPKWISSLSELSEEKIVQLCSETTTGETSFSIYVKFFTMSIAKAEPSKVKFLVNALLNHVISPLPASSKDFNKDKKAQYRFALLTALTVLQIVVQLRSVPPDAVLGLWTLNLQTRILGLGEKNPAWMFRLNGDYDSLMTLFEGLLPLLGLAHRRKDSAALKLADMAKSVGAICFQIADAVVASAKDAIAKGHDPKSDPVAPKRHECLILFLKTLSNMESINSFSSRSSGPFLLDLLPGQVVRLVLSNHVEHGKKVQPFVDLELVAVLSTLGDWVKSLVTNRSVCP